MFIDLVKIEVQSGHGGNGAVAWRREKYVPRGGPAGGNGGWGGHVYLEADKTISTLLEFRYKSIFEAENGENGRAKSCHGKKGQDLIIKVPEGTIVKDHQHDVIIADLSHHGQKVLVAAGGKGGRGNESFKSSTHQAPQFCEPGDPGVHRILELELKLLADVGIIGLPNAGKSTFISSVSAAKPKIADYPFTTLIPNLGVIKTPDFEGVVFADIPGLIKGSSEGQGLGHQFLRHVERTRLLIHMVDILDTDPLENYNVINSELKKYSDHLSSLEQIIAINKIDSTDNEMVNLIKDLFKAENKKLFAISAVTKQGVQDLLNYVFQRLNEIPKETRTFDVLEDPAAYNNDDSHYEVYRNKDVFVVDGGKIKRLVSVTDITNNESVYKLERQLKAMGVFIKLKEAGAYDGDLVVIGSYEFEYYDDEISEYENFNEEIADDDFDDEFVEEIEIL